MAGFVRTRWAALGAAVAISLGAGGIGLSQAALDTGERPVLVSIQPCRLIDTRGAVGARTTPLGPGEILTLEVTGSTGECSGITNEATAAALNVTAIRGSAQSFLTVFPANLTSVPNSSNLNWRGGDPPTPNKVDVKLSPGGAIKIFNSVGTVHVAVDLVGYYIDHTHDDRYYTETEVDALIASIPGGPGADYEHLLVVAKSGGDFTSVTAAMAAIGTGPYPTASATERYLVWVAPGVYDGEDVDMQPFVDIEGSGQGVTVLRSTGGSGGITPNAATLVGASNAELRDITVEIEAASAGSWTHAIYTAGATTFRNVTAVASGGAHPRGIMVNTGGSPLFIDVVARAVGGSNTSTAIDVFGSTALGDGVYAEASGGVNARGIYVNQAASEVLLENVTTRASEATSQTVGLWAVSSDVTVEGYRTTVEGSASLSSGTICSGAGNRFQMLGGVVYAATAATSGSVRGLTFSSCDAEVRDVVIDAIGTTRPAYGLYHLHGDTVDPANVTVSDVEIRAESGGSSSYGVLLNSSNASTADTYGRISNTNVRSIGGTTASNSAGVLHSANGEVQYRGLTIISGGSANFLYGVQANRGAPRFDDVVIDASGDASTTVFGAELLADDSSLSNARVRAINTATGSLHDAVGVKANNATGVTFTDIVAEAEAETGVWGVDLTNADATLIRVDAAATGTPGTTVRGMRCLDGSADLRHSTVAALAGNLRIGFDAIRCEASVTGSTLHGRLDGGGTSAGVSTFGTAPNIASVLIRESLIIGGETVVTSTDSEVYVVNSSLDGGPGFSAGGASDVQECTAVTYNSGGGEAFQAVTVDPCP